MKKRILCFAIMLAMLFGIAPLQGMAAEPTDVDVRFGKFLIGIDYISSAQISNANVTAVTKLDAVPEEGETNRIHYQVELSKYTQDGDVVLVDMAVWNQTASGMGSALKKELVGSVGARNDTDDTHYEVKIDQGKGRMICYSYYDHTKYTTLVIDFIVGNNGTPYAAPEKVAVKDNLFSTIHVWDTDIMKSYCKQIDYENSVIYIWLEEDVPDDAVIGLQPLYSGCAFSETPEGWNDMGGYVQLKNGSAEFSFSLKGTHTGKLGTVRLYKVYIKNYMSYAPERITDAQVELQAEVNIPFTVKFNDYFTDKDGDSLTYEVSVNGAPAVPQTTTRYRMVPSENGKTVLTVTAFDGILRSEPCEIVINAMNDHVWGDWTILKASSCKEDGLKSRSCRCCGLTEQKDISSEGHTWSDWIVKDKANCKENGSKVHVCTRCGEMETEEIPLGDHDWIVTSTTVTCGEDGIDQLKCSVCGEVSQRNADATGLHQWTEWDVSTAPSCTTEGEQIRHCTACGKEESEKLSKTDHDWGNWQIKTVSTCGTAGEQIRICGKCKGEESKEIPISGDHSWGIWNVIKEPTVDAEGLREHSCAICGETESEVLPLEQYAYVTISDYRGVLVVARETVPLVDRNQNGIFDIDDVLISAHELYGNPGGYSSAGEYIEKLWGLPTMGIGFLQNDSYSTSVKTKVSHGDDIYAFVYQDYMSYSDKYAIFDKKEVYLQAGGFVELGLSCYNYNSVVPQILADAKITINGNESEYATNSEGKVTLFFDDPGTYLISATSSTVITPPICIVYVQSQEIQRLDAPVLTDAYVTGTSVTVVPPVNSLQDPNAVLEYSISEDNEHWGAWQKSNVFEDLKSSSRYYVRARYCTSDLMQFETSDASLSLEVNTAGLNSVIFTFGEITATPGETVLIPVSVQCDALLVSRWNVAFDFDKSVFIMNGVTAADGMDDWKIKANLFTKTAYGVPADGRALEMPEGELFYLSLTVREDAEEGSYPVSLGNTWNVGLKNTFFDENGKYLLVDGRAVSGSVTVAEQKELTNNENDSTDHSVNISALEFLDVSADAWYYESVQYMTKTELMKGITADIFSPETYTTRAMLVTMLYRIEGEPDATTAHSFADVAEGRYYSEAVKWAAETGIIKGVSETAFAPNENVTRQQMATILHRYAAYLGVDTFASADLSTFADGNLVASYAADAMAWAVAEGLIYGTGINLEPDSVATRAQVAAVLSRCLGD